MITISQKVLRKICTEGEKQYPNECCGILFGRMTEEGNKIVEEIEPVKNSFGEGETYHRFLITPEQMRKAELKARSENKDIVGFYHSHPNCLAAASEYDRAHALPVYSYLIVSVAGRQAQEVRSWELMNGGIFQEEKINMV